MTQFPVFARAEARRPFRLQTAVALAVTLLAQDACGPATTESTPDDWGVVQPPAGGVAAFTALPMITTGTLTPLGNLNPPGHTLPTNHVYFYAVQFDHPPATPDTIQRPVYAPATGTVAYMLQPVGTDWKIAFRVTENFYYYLDHVQLTTLPKVGDIVHAGDQIGVTNPGGAIDLGAYDMSVTLTGFANPSRYGVETLHCVSPWAYFVEPLRSENYARIRRVAGAPDKDGHIDLDIAGTLAGAWFDESIGTGNVDGPTGWPKTLTFVTDYYDPSKIRVVIGGTIATKGIWTIPADAPAPRDVTPASGLVTYRLMYTESTSVQWGVMLLQMTDATHLKVEVFPGSEATATAFDANARLYIR